MLQVTQLLKDLGLRRGDATVQRLIGQWYLGILTDRDLEGMLALRVYELREEAS